MRHERTGEFRSPKQGEWYECRATGGPEFAKAQGTCKNWILRCVETTQERGHAEYVGRVAREHLGVILEEVFGELDAGSLETNCRLEQVARAALRFLHGEGVLPEFLEKYLPEETADTVKNGRRNGK